MKKVRVQSYQHIQRQIRNKKIESKNTPKKESSPTKHFKESSFLLVSDPLEDLNFQFFGLGFFQQIFMKKVKSAEHIQQQIRLKKTDSKNTPKKVRKRWPSSPPLFRVKERSFLPSQNEGSREASSNPPVFGSGRSSRPAEGRGPRGTLYGVS